MSITAYLTKRFNALRAMDQIAAEALGKIVDGEVVKVEIKRANQRSLRHHRLFFALLEIVGECQDEPWTKDQTLTWVKVAAGHTDPVYDRDGKVTFIPRSISFDSMSQDEFRAFFDAAVQAVLDKLLPPGTPRHSIVQEVEERAALMSRRAA